MQSPALDGFAEHDVTGADGKARADEVADEVADAIIDQGRIAATGKVRPLIPLQIIENASAGLSAANRWQRSPGKVCISDLDHPPRLTVAV
jgi:hypothetical protein